MYCEKHIRAWQQQIHVYQLFDCAQAKAAPTTARLADCKRMKYEPRSGSMRPNITAGSVAAASSTLEHLSVVTHVSDSAAHHTRAYPPTGSAGADDLVDLIHGVAIICLPPVSGVSYHNTAEHSASRSEWCHHTHRLLFT